MPYPGLFSLESIKIVVKTKKNIKFGSTAIKKQEFDKHSYQ